MAVGFNLANSGLSFRWMALAMHSEKQRHMHQDIGIVETGGFGLWCAAGIPSVMALRPRIGVENDLRVPGIITCDSRPDAFGHC